MDDYISKLAASVGPLVLLPLFLLGIYFVYRGFDISFKGWGLEFRAENRTRLGCRERPEQHGSQE